MGWLVAFGLGFSPADRDQEEAVRILYVHVPTIWIAYLAFVVTALGSAIYLFGRNHSLGFDRLAGASAEIGVAFVAVTLVVGSLWGRLTWGVFWRWDAAPRRRPRCCSSATSATSPSVASVAVTTNAPGAAP